MQTNSDDVRVHVQTYSASSSRRPKDHRVCGGKGLFQPLHLPLPAVSHVLNLLRKFGEESNKIVLLLEHSYDRSPLLRALQLVHQFPLRPLVMLLPPPRLLPVYLHQLLAEDVPVEVVGDLQRKPVPPQQLLVLDVHLDAGQVRPVPGSSEQNLDLPPLLRVRLQVAILVGPVEGPCQLAVLVLDRVVTSELGVWQERVTPRGYLRVRLDSVHHCPVPSLHLHDDGGPTGPIPHVLVDLLDPPEGQGV
eukprot:763521-Hanusia_phi.AAC.14